MFGRSRRARSNAGLMLVFSVVVPFCSQAQLEVGVPLILVGPSSSDRQVTGLGEPVQPSDAVSLDAARGESYSTTFVTGTSALLGDLTPAPGGYVPGMMVTIVPISINADGATLDLNGLGPRPIIKAGGAPLSFGDLRPQVPARLAYDGDSFQLVSGTGLPCMAGFLTINRGYCIAEDPFEATSFFNAVTTCSDLGARLCTISEWSHACRTVQGFFATVVEAEWVDHAANNNTGAKLVGHGIDGGAGGAGSGCEYGGQDASNTNHRFRCCTNR